MSKLNENRIFIWLHTTAFFVSGHNIVSFISGEQFYGFRVMDTLLRISSSHASERIPVALILCSYCISLDCT